MSRMHDHKTGKVKEEERIRRLKKNEEDDKRVLATLGL